MTEFNIVATIWAVTIAIIAFVVSFKSFNLANDSIKVSQKSLNVILEHNKISLRPKLQIYHQKAPQTDNGIGIYIENNGTGPAIIDSFTISVADVAIPDERWQPIHANPDFKQLYHQEDMVGGFVHVGEHIPPQKRIPLWTSRSFDSTIEQRGKFRRLMNDIAIEVKYRSAYNEHHALTFPNQKSG